MKNIIIAAIILSTMSCAAGRKMSFENKTISPDYTMAKSMIVGFQDNRAYVLEGKQKPSFCGQLKSTIQIPYNMQTKSGKPLAAEFTNAVVTSLSKLGIKALPMLIELNTPQDSILARFIRTDAERLVHFNVKQWESNLTPTFEEMRYEVTWELVISVFDRSGNLLATRSVAERVTKKPFQLAGSKEHLQKLADEVFTEQVKFLLNDPAVKASLVN